MHLHSIISLAVCTLAACLQKVFFLLNETNTLSFCKIRPEGEPHVNTCFTSCSSRRRHRSLSSVTRAPLSVKCEGNSFNCTVCILCFRCGTHELKAYRVYRSIFTTCCSENASLRYTDGNACTLFQNQRQVTEPENHSSEPSHLASGARSSFAL